MVDGCGQCEASALGARFDLFPPLAMLKFFLQNSRNLPITSRVLSSFFFLIFFVFFSSSSVFQLYTHLLSITDTLMNDPNFTLVWIESVLNLTGVMLKHVPYLSLVQTNLLLPNPSKIYLPQFH